MRGGRWLAILTLVGAVVLTAAARAAGAHDGPERAGAAAPPGSPSPSLAVIGPAPPFALVDPTGRSVSLADYAGRVVLLSFVYTTCRSACPLVTQRMAVLQRRLREAGGFWAPGGVRPLTPHPRPGHAPAPPRQPEELRPGPPRRAVLPEPAPRPAPPSAPPVLPPVVVTAPPPVAASSGVLIPGRDFELRPQGRPADVVRLIPGFVISQHQGGGKAEQYFLRGFDADHGTDVALFVDGMPVNLRSHAHGQGYADLHFLIPETVKLVDGLKGPYFVEFGDFATAGAVNLVTKDLVDANTGEAAGGKFNTQA